MTVTVYYATADRSCILKNAKAVRVGDNGALFVLLSNGRDCGCWAPGQWAGYRTEGA